MPTNSSPIVARKPRARSLSNSYVLDATALLCVWQDEPGSSIVRNAIASGAVVSAVNLSEVISKLSERGVTVSDIDATVHDADLTIIVFDAIQARAAGLLRSLTRGVGASFADRACLALAAARGATAVTADRAWQRLDIGIKIELIR